MNFLYFLFGVVVGMVGSAVFFLGALLDKNSHSVNNVVSILERTARSINQEKGAVLYPKSDEVMDMEAAFAANDKQGIDTPVGEIEGND